MHKGASRAQSPFKVDESMTEIEALREQLHTLQGIVDHMLESVTDAAVQSRMTASIKALASIVQELAEKYGVSEDRFDEVFAQRAQVYYQYELETLENGSPDLAARINAVLPANPDAEELMPLYPEEE
jgi:hypothetical protein